MRRLGLNESDGYGGLLAAIVREPERVVGPAALLAGLSGDDIHGARGLLAADEVFRPALSVEGGVYEFGSSFGLVECHGILDGHDFSSKSR